MDTYGKRLEAALKEKKLDPIWDKKERKWLAGRIGITEQAVSQVILGKTKALSAENHEYAVNALGCSGMWLATGKGEMFLKADLSGDWPFDLILPSQYQQLDSEFRRHIENNIAGEWMRVQANVKTG